MINVKIKAKEDKERELNGNMISYLRYNYARIDFK